MAAYVYLLKHATDACMKIGKANCVRARANSLGPQKFDFASSWAVRVPDTEAAYDLEKALGKLFKRFSVARPGEVDGRTEWYDASCLQRALQLLEREGDLFSATVLRVAELPAAPERHSAATRPVRRVRPVLCEQEMQHQNDSILGAALARLIAFQELAFVFVGAEDPRSSAWHATRLLFIAKEPLGAENEIYVEDARYQCFSSAFEALARSGVLVGPNELALHQLWSGAACHGSASKPDRVSGQISVARASSLRGLVSEYALAEFQATVGRLEPCEPWLDAEVQEAGKEFWRRWSEDFEDEDIVEVNVPRGEPRSRRHS